MRRAVRLTNYFNRKIKSPNKFVYIEEFNEFAATCVVNQASCNAIYELAGLAKTFLVRVHQSQRSSTHAGSSALPSGVREQRDAPNSSFVNRLT